MIIIEDPNRTYVKHIWVHATEVYTNCIQVIYKLYKFQFIYGWDVYLLTDISLGVDYIGLQEMNRTTPC